MFSGIWYKDSANDLSNIHVIYERELSISKRFISNCSCFSPVCNTHSYCHCALFVQLFILYRTHCTKYRFIHIRNYSNSSECACFSTTVHLLTFLERAAHVVKTFQFSGKSLKIEVCTTIFLLLPPNSDVNRSRILLPTIAFNPTILPVKSIPKTQPQSCNQCVLILTAG